MVNRLIGKRDKERRAPFPYRMRTPEQMKARATQSSGKWDSPFVGGITNFKVQQGESCFRILPPTWDNHEHWGYDIWVHQYVGANNGTYLCPLKMKKAKSCPICEAAEDAQAHGDKEAAKEMAVARRVLAWVIDRDNPGEGPKLYNMAWSQDRDISALCLPKRGKALFIDHPDEGYDVIMQRSGQGLNTRYFGLSIDREPTPISDNAKEQDRWLSYIEENPIPNILKYHTAEQLEAAISGTGESKDEDLDEGEEEEQETRGRSSRRSRDRDEERDERGSRRGARSGRDRDPPPEEEEEPEDEQEEENADEGEEQEEENADEGEEQEDEGAEETEEEGEEEGEAEEEQPEEETRASRRGRDREERPRRSRRDEPEERPRREARNGRGDDRGRSFRRQDDDRRPARRTSDRDPPARRGTRDRDDERPRRR